MKSAGWVFRVFRRARPAAQRRRRWTRDRLIISTAIALGIMAILVIFADAASITFARSLPKWVIDTAHVITAGGRGVYFTWPLAGAVLALLVISAILPRHAALLTGAIGTRVLFLYLAIALPIVFTDIVKGIVGRARPFVGGSANPFLFQPFDWHPAYASFPSGHGTTAFAVAVAFGALWPRLRNLLWVYAGIILITRVIVTAHHPSDVMAGAIVGGIGALLVRDYFAKRSLGLAVGLDGRVKPLPWPRISAPT